MTDQNQQKNELDFINGYLVAVGGTVQGLAKLSGRGNEIADLLERADLSKHPEEFKRGHSVFIQALRATCGPANQK